MQNQIDTERNIALERKVDGTQVTDFDGEKGVRTFTPNNLNGSILSQQKQKPEITQEKTELDKINAELNNEYKSGKLKLGDYIQILAGAASDAFAIPGTGSNVMQGVLARQAASEDAMRSDYDARRSNLIERKNTLLDDQKTQQESERAIVGEVTPELVDGVWVNQGRNKYGKPINLGPVSTSDLTQMDKTMKMNDLEIEALETTIEMNRLGINPESKKVIFSENDDGILVGTTQFDTKFGGVHTRKATEAEIRDQGTKDRLDKLEIDQMIANLAKTETETETIKSTRRTARQNVNKPKEMFTLDGDPVNVRLEGSTYVDLTTGLPYNEVLLSGNNYKIADESQKQKIIKQEEKKKAEEVGAAFESGLYELLSNENLLSAYGSESLLGGFPGSEAASLQTQITKLVAPGTLKVISENTFGPLSEKELVFAGTASNAISNYMLTKEDAFIKFLQLENTIAKARNVELDYRNMKLDRNVLLNKLEMSKDRKYIPALDNLGRVIKDRFVPATAVNLSEYYLKTKKSWLGK